MVYYNIDEYIKIHNDFKDGKIKDGEMPNVIEYLNEYKDYKKKIIYNKLKYLYMSLLIYKYQEGKGKQIRFDTEWYKKIYQYNIEDDLYILNTNNNWNTSYLRDSFTLKDMQDIYKHAIYDLSINFAGENRSTEDRWIDKIPKEIPEELYIDNLFPSKKHPDVSIESYYKKYKKDFKNDYIMVYVIHPLLHGWYRYKEYARDIIIDDVRKYYNNTDKHIEILDDEVNYFEDEYNRLYGYDDFPNQKEIYNIGISIKYLSRANVVYNITSCTDDTSTAKLYFAKLYNKEIIDSHIEISSLHDNYYLNKSEVQHCADEVFEFGKISNRYKQIPDVFNHLVIIMKYILKFRYHDKYKSKAWADDMHKRHKSYDYLKIPYNIKNIIGSNYILDKAYEQARKDAMKDRRCKDIYIPEERPEDFTLDNIIIYYSAYILNYR